MKLYVVAVHDRGNPKNERVVLEAREDCNALNFILADRADSTDDDVFRKVSYFYSFPDMNIRKGEHIVI